MIRIGLALVISMGCACGMAQAAPQFEQERIFDPQQDNRGHVHASCVIECPDGSLRAVWYENGPALLPPFFSEQKDKSDDVRIAGSRKPAGGTWEAPFAVTDTFGASDNNPCLVIDREQRLWLFYPTLTGVPKWSWASALLRYKVSEDYSKPGPPVWARGEILLPRPEKLRETVEGAVAEAEAKKLYPEALLAEFKKEFEEVLANPVVERLGWMPRVHPLLRSDGALVVPLSNENFTVACMAITKDAGQTWTWSAPVPGVQLSQPSLVEYPDGAISAFFRNEGGDNWIKRSDSKDGGLTWSAVSNTTLVHPGAGVEALLLKSGALLMVYNDSEKERDRLAASLSEDRGITWKWTRQIENTPGGRFDYPSVIQSKDGTIHVTYSDGTKTIKHAWFNEEWVRESP